jgi:hypothetical protein
MDRSIRCTFPSFGTVAVKMVCVPSMRATPVAEVSATMGAVGTLAVAFPVAVVSTTPVPAASAAAGTFATLGSG